MRILPKKEGFVNEAIDNPTLFDNAVITANPSHVVTSSANLPFKHITTCLLYDHKWRMNFLNEADFLLEDGWNIK